MKQGISTINQGLRLTRNTHCASSKKTSSVEKHPHIFAEIQQDGVQALDAVLAHQ
jgi:hypothetical protein